MSKRVPLHATIKENGCWEVNSHKPQSGGYPCVFRNGIKTRTHVFVYSLVNGEIEKGKVIRHICNNTICINPDHLVQGTHAENVNDKILAGHQPRGESHGMSKLTEENVRYIRLKNKEGITILGLAAQFHVTKNCIIRILNRDGWSHVKSIINS
jgi:hypothetical protein